MSIIKKSLSIMGLLTQAGIIGQLLILPESASPWSLIGSLLAVSVMMIATSDARFTVPG